MPLHRFAALLLFTVATPFLLFADIYVVDFETFPNGTAIPDSTSITAQFPGLTFTDTTVINSGISLNEFEFPPHSGNNVAFDDGGPISIAFATPVRSFGGYFTYAEPLTLAAFFSTTQVASASSGFSNNEALSGDPGSSPNEFLSVVFPSGISEVTITGDPLGGSFTLDDATISTITPEPSSLIWLVTITFGGLLLIKATRHSRTLQP